MKLNKTVSKLSLAHIASFLTVFSTLSIQTEFSWNQRTPLFSKNKGFVYAATVPQSGLKNALHASLVLNSQDATSQEDGSLKTAGQLVNSEFVVRLQVQIFGKVAPRCVRLRLHRESTDETCCLTAHRLLSQKEGFVYGAQWNVTRQLGLWSILVDSAPLESRVALPVEFGDGLKIQIDKRQQIKQLSLQWVDKKLTSARQIPYFTACDSFVSYVYTHLGLSQPMLGQVAPVSVSDTGTGAVRFYSSPDDKNSVVGIGHMAIVSDALHVIDNNWGNSDAGPQEHFNTDLLQTYYSWASSSYSPADPQNPHQSLLDAS